MTHCEPRYHGRTGIGNDPNSRTDPTTTGTHGGTNQPTSTCGTNCHQNGATP